MKHSPPRRRYWAAIALLGALALQALPAAAATAPPPPDAQEVIDPSQALADARTQLAALTQAAQAAGDAFAAASASRDAALSAAEAARREAETATRRAEEARVELGSYAATAYINGGTPANLAATLDAGSPSELLSRQNTLDAVAGTSSDLVRVLRDAQSQAKRALVRAEKHDALAERSAADAQRAAQDAQSAVAQAETLVSTLTAQEVAAQNAAMLRARSAAYASGAGSLVAPDGAPLEFSVYGNGRIPLELLSEISGTGHRLWAPAARSFEALLTAAAHDGVAIGITDSYRPYEAQVAVAARTGLYTEGGLAAAPGTSDHGWGLALDLTLDGRALEWMRAHAAAFGFLEDTPRETWHWGYYPTADPVAP